MNTEELILQQYKLYSEQKEKFVDRSFHTNKFYLTILIIMVLAICFTQQFSFVYGINTTLIFGAAGAAVSILWWINVDAYNFLIKVKLSKVLEEIETKLPVQPYTQEFSAIKDFRKNKREFVFADIQKLIAILSFLLFFIFFLDQVLGMIIN